MGCASGQDDINLERNQFGRKSGEPIRAILAACCASAASGAARSTQMNSRRLIVSLVLQEPEQRFVERRGLFSRSVVQSVGNYNES